MQIGINWELRDWRSVSSGTRQGDIQSPPLFNFYLNFSAYLMGQEKVISGGASLQRASPGVEGKHLLDTDYADDMALVEIRKHQGGFAGNHRLSREKELSS